MSSSIRSATKPSTPPTISNLSAVSIPFVTSTPPALAPAIQPSASSSDLIVVPASPLEYVQTWHLNGGEWKGPLSVEQYLHREQFLKDQNLTRDDNITAWILTSPSLPLNDDGSRQILSSCETLVKHAYVARHGILNKILAHGIASVYTRPEYRGRGYAGRMMVEVGKALNTWQQPNGAKGSFSVLYSDIGTKFYSRYAWKVHDSTNILLPPLSCTEEMVPIQRAALNTLQDLSAEDLKGVPTIQHMEGQLRTRSLEKPGIPHIAIRPDLDHFSWHHAREEIQTHILGLGPPTTKGAIHRPTGTALIWTRVFSNDPKENQLVILRTLVPEYPTDHADEIEDALAALLLRAQVEAERWQMHGGVEVWSPESIVVRAAGKFRGDIDRPVEVVTRDKEHICSLRWVGGVEGESEDAVWLGTERYAWC